MVTKEGGGIFDFYDSRSQLYKDVYIFLPYLTAEQLSFALSSGLNSFWSVLSWETKPVNSVQRSAARVFSLFSADGAFHTYTILIPENERYNVGGQFLNRFLQTITIDFLDFPGEIEVDYIKLKPKYPLIIEAD